MTTTLDFTQSTTTPRGRGRVPGASPHKRIDSIYRDTSLAELAMLPITFDETIRGVFIPRSWPNPLSSTRAS
jgi:hypothetical protein